MTHTYEVTGMTCEACEAKVKYLLGKVEGVKNVTVDRSKNEAVVEMGPHIQTETLAAALRDYPKYKLSEVHLHTAVTESAEDESRTWLETYKPLLTVFAYITLFSTLTSFHAGQFMPMEWMNRFMAGFFITFSFFKMLDLRGFADSYSMYDVIAMRIRSYGYLYPFIELTLGIAYLLGLNPLVTNWATVIVMGVSIIGVIQSVLDKRKIRCACLGAVFNLPMSTVTIIEDALMIAMATIALILPQI